MQNYADSVESIRGAIARSTRWQGLWESTYPSSMHLDSASGGIGPKMGHAEVLLGALISGLTNVVAFTVDELGHRYTGIPGIVGEKVNMHDVGQEHWRFLGKIIRDRARTNHMAVIDRIVKRRKSCARG